MALLKAFTDKVRSIGAAPAIAAALALSAAPANAENEAARATAVSVADIQPGQRVTEEQARALSREFGQVVIFCADDARARWNCESAAGSVERLSNASATWVTGYGTAGSAVVMACGRGGNTVFNVAEDGPGDIGAAASVGYNALESDS